MVVFPKRPVVGDDITRWEFVLGRRRCVCVWWNPCPIVKILKREEGKSLHKIHWNRADRPKFRRISVEKDFDVFIPFVSSFPLIFSSPVYLADNLAGWSRATETFQRFAIGPKTFSCVTGHLWVLLLRFDCTKVTAGCLSLYFDTELRICDDSVWLLSVWSLAAFERPSYPDKYPIWQMHPTSWNVSSLVYLARQLCVLLCRTASDTRKNTQQVFSSTTVDTNSTESNARPVRWKANRCHLQWHKSRSCREPTILFSSFSF